MKRYNCYFEEKSFSPAKRVCEFAKCQQVSCESKFLRGSVYRGERLTFTDGEFTEVLDKDCGRNVSP